MEAVKTEIENFGNGVKAITTPDWWKASADGLFGPTVWKSFNFCRGDVGGFFQLGADNLATVLALSNLLSFKYGLGILNDDDIYGSVLPGLAISMVFGNLWYSWLACRLSAKEGRNDVTAQPYGINTPGSYAVLYGVLLTEAFKGKVCTFDTQDDPECIAKSKHILHIGVAANLLQGLLASLFGLVGPYIAKLTPLPALYSANAGIGFAFLLIGQIVQNFQQPLSGFAPLFLMFILFFGGVGTGRFPEAVMGPLVGTILAWMDGVATGDNVDLATDQVKWHGVTSTWGEAFDNLSALNEYVGLIVPIALASAISTLMCWRAGADNGDEFPLRETMIVDGIGSMVAALFGCPFGTSVYVGHTAYKRIGARSGYSILNCLFIGILGLFGLFALISSIVPTYTVAPNIAFVGLLIVSDSIEQLPLRHLPALIFGITPAVCDWANNNCKKETFSGEPCFVDTNNVGPGIKALQNGYMLNSMVLTTMIALTIDRKYRTATIWAFGAAFLSLFGIMHQSEINDDFGEGGAVAKWRFATGYMVVCGFFAIIYLCQTFGSQAPGFLGELLGNVEKPVSDDKAYISCGQLCHLARDMAGGENPMLLHQFRASERTSERVNKDTELTHLAGADKPTV